MTQLRTTAAWQLLSFNWVLVGLMGLALVLGVALTGFSIKPQSALLTFVVTAVYVSATYYNAYAPHKRDPFVVFVLGSTAQMVLITFLMTPMTYIAAAVDLPMKDVELNHLDQALGLDWPAYFYFIYDRPHLLGASLLFYGMIGLPVFGIPIVLGATKHYRRLQEFTLAFALALVATTIISVFVPAIGTYDLLGINPDPAIFTPQSYFDQLRDLPLVRSGALRALDVPSLAGIVTFPSFHAAAAALYIWAFWSVWWMRPPALIICVGMILATPLQGGHYFVDVFAGIAVAVLAIVAARRLGEWLTAPAAPPVLAAQPAAAE
jgi:hypothetical protein